MADPSVRRSPATPTSRHSMADPSFCPSPVTLASPHSMADQSPSSFPLPTSRYSKADPSLCPSPATQTSPPPLPDQLPSSFPLPTSQYSKADPSLCPSPATQTSPSPIPDQSPSSPVSQTAPYPKADSSPSNSPTSNSPHSTADSSVRSSSSSTLSDLEKAKPITRPRPKARASVCIQSYFRECFLKKPRCYFTWATFLVLLIMAIVIPLTLKHTSKKTDANLASEISPITEAVGDNFPDPSLLNINGIWYAFATNNAAGNLPRPRDDDKNSVPQPDLGVANIQVATSPDFKNWTLSAASGDPLPTVGSWAIQGRSTQSPFLSNSNVWAPAILQRPTDGKYVMYYAAAVTGRFHCMGAAISDPDSPTGPYSPLPESIACPVDQGGAIDPAAFIDIDNRIYVSWKIDGNAMGHGGSCGNMKAPQRDTPIMMQPMQPDGLTPIGSPIAILNRTAADGPLVEAPAFVRSSGGVYFLFFSSGCTHDSSYNLKYAWATNITGPYTRAPFPLIQTGDWGLVAPGSCDMIPDSDGGVALAFHARVWNEYGGVRAMFTSKLYLNGTRASLLAPRKSVNATVFANTTLSTPLGLPGNGTILASNSTAGDSTPDVEVQSLNSTTSFSSNSTVPFALNSDDDDD